MQIIMSSLARPELRPYVRAYAQRVCEKSESAFVISVPAQVEQILNFELGVMPGIHHRDGLVSEVVAVGGTQTSFSGYLDVRPGVESFAVFFQPAGWSTLLKTPIHVLTNRFMDATAVADSSLRELWNRLGEASLFESRVLIVEEYLLDRVPRVVPRSEITASADFIFKERGAVGIAALAGTHSLGLRQFERRFEREMGLSPKSFARIARFQFALDAKLVSPQRTWLNIAHSFGYHDQMHMIHDFEALGRATPTHLIEQMADARPSALAFEENL
jgi:AraC-like DNA-binding protein